MKILIELYSLSKLKQAVQSSRVPNTWFMLALYTGVKGGLEEIKIPAGTVSYLDIKRLQLLGYTVVKEVNDNMIVFNVSGWDNE